MQDYFALFHSKSGVRCGKLSISDASLGFPRERGIISLSLITLISILYHSPLYLMLPLYTSLLCFDFSVRKGSRVFVLQGSQRGVFSLRGTERGNPHMPHFYYIPRGYTPSRYDLKCEKGSNEGEKGKAATTSRRCMPLTHT